MSSFIIIIHIVVAVALILIVLLQTGKGADMGAAFGGGSSQTLFGGAGASTFLSRLTTIAAIVFMLTSLGLAYFSGHRATRSVMSQMPAPTTEQTERAPSEAPVQAEQVPSEAPVQPSAKEANTKKETPPTKEVDVAKGTRGQSREAEPSQQSD
ncbi:MAG: preprotein translocase subunit SecG [Deltaproteobacteria bacterium]|nr:preprotein translocase subunit SecG [Deltaproteobacteria bacterium]